ncbi:unnamed protein product [Dibothriocephalus latus]|uniref:Uncharacterized protein n=1 Tax=Dibothriocephalus latus TaxID=60516 RepID=A0A3P7L108_DIBLA|nr:unnamed protein product [Dibothriocephalus latus]
MGRLSRMNGFTPGLMTNSTASSAQSFGQQNKNRSRPEGAPVGGAFANSAANSAALPCISNRYGGCEVDDPLPSHGCDLSDFASNPSVLVANPPATTVSQSSQLLPTDRGNPEKNQVVVATGKAAGNRPEENCTVNRIQVPPLTSRVLTTFREASDEENDEDNIPGAQRIGQQVGRRGIMVGEPSATSSKVKLSAEVPLRDQRSRAPVNGNKTLADTKPFSYPNLLVPPSGLKSQPTRASSKPIVRSVSPTESVESAAKRGSHVNTSAGQHKSAAQHQQKQLHRVGSGSTAPSNAPHAMPGGNNNAKCSVM